jgi:hypothetical protein
MSYSYGKSIVTDGLVFYVDAANSKSYDGSAGGTTWTDLVGDNDGTLTNMETNPANAGYAYDSGNGGSIVFDNTNDYAQTGTITTFSSFTLDFWVYLGSAIDGNSIISKRVAYQNQQDFNLFLFTNSNQLSLDVGNTRVSGTNLAGSTLYNIVATYDSSNGAVKVYVNNSININSTISTGLITSNTSDTYIGRLGGSTYYWGGKIFTGKIYNRALSASEITQNYNALKNRFV